MKIEEKKLGGSSIKAASASTLVQSMCVFVCQIRVGVLVMPVLNSSHFFENSLLSVFPNTLPPLSSAKTNSLVLPRYTGKKKKKSYTDIEPNSSEVRSEDSFKTHFSPFSPRNTLINLTKS